MTIITVQRTPAGWRRLLLPAAFLTGIALLASGRATPQPAVQHGPQLSTWRRTRDGWEQPRWLVRKQPPLPAPLHPIYVALLVILLTAMALVAHAPFNRTLATISPPHFSAAGEVRRQRWQRTRKV